MIPIRFSKRDVLRAYSNHPLKERAILDRIEREKGSLDKVCVDDFAVDSSSEITDQNHIGGMRFVMELAERAGIDASKVVLDLGCGLGGPARVLASRFGCRVYGIDLSPKRCREAGRMTERVGLEKLVTIQCRDFFRDRRPSIRVDVLWGQSAWVHVYDPKVFLRKWSRSLKTGGVIAMEDAVIENSPKTALQRRLVRCLEKQWNAYLAPTAIWLEALRAVSFKVCLNETLNNTMEGYFSKLLRIDHGSSVSESERSAWRNAVQLAQCGILGYRRIVAKEDLP